jgi:type VI protein secretion system component VasF
MQWASRGKTNPTGVEVMHHLHPEQWANFTAKVETLCGEFLHAIERDRYSPAEVIQAACIIITAVIDETAEKEVAIQAAQRWIKTSLEWAKAGNNPTRQLN